MIGCRLQCSISDKSLSFRNQVAHSTKGENIFSGAIPGSSLLGSTLHIQGSLCPAEEKGRCSSVQRREHWPCWFLCLCGLQVKELWKQDLAPSTAEWRSFALDGRIWFVKGPLSTAQQKQNGKTLRAFCRQVTFRKSLFNKSQKKRLWGIWQNLEMVTV